MWVITSQVNDYNQHGEYFECTFINKPIEEELIKLGFNVEHMLKGGGRIGNENCWYNLVEVNNGEMYSK